jgi:hypothetical protein
VILRLEEPVRRRDFITFLGGAAAWPLAARGQPGDRVRRIGLLMGTADDREGQARVTALKQGLQELGWTDGQFPPSNSDKHLALPCEGCAVKGTPTPVALPPGRLRLATMPSWTGSPAVINTMGIVVVAAFAASAGGGPPAVTMTATRRRTRSGGEAWNANLAGKIFFNE